MKSLRNIGIILSGLIVIVTVNTYSPIQTSDEHPQPIKTIIVEEDE